MPIIVNLDVMMAKRKISLNELSDRVGLTLSNLSILKTGKAKAIRFSTLEAVCNALDCQPGDILEYRRNENKTSTSEIAAVTTRGKSQIWTLKQTSLALHLGYDRGNGVHTRLSWPTHVDDHTGPPPRFHIHIAVKHNPLAQPNCAINPERTDYGPSGPTPTSATIVPHHLPTQLNRSAALRSLH